MKRQFFFVLLASVSCYATDFVFYVQDAGETYGLLPVAKELREKGADVRILTGGTAESLLSGKEESIGSFGIQIDSSWARTNRADSKIIASMIEALDPKVFISGVAFELEGQMYDACKEKGIQTIAFWDNFSSEGDDLYFKVARQVQERADALWVPSAQVAAAFSERESVVVTGHPSLERWASEAATVDAKVIRAKLGIPEETKLAVFIGGYGELYEQAFKLFLESIALSQGTTFYIQPHPKFGGQFESKMLLDHPTLPVRLSKGEISTVDAVASADVVCCHLSTVGFQALFLKKPVVYFIPEGQKYPSFAENRVEHPLEFGEALKRAEKGIVCEVPTGSVQRCVELLEFKSL